MGPHGQIVTIAKSVIKSAHGLYPITSCPNFLSTRIGPQNILVTHLPSLLFFNCLGSPNSNGPVSPLLPKSQVYYAAEFQPAKTISRKLTTQMNLNAISAIISLKTITQMYTSRGSLKTHIQSIHKRKIFPCQHCEQKFTRKGERDVSTNTQSPYM